MKVWRMHIKNDFDKSEGRTIENLYDFCKDNELIGVGWQEITTRINDAKIIAQQAQKYESRSGAAKRALEAMRKMSIDDLVWTRMGKIYYLCRVTSLWENNIPNEEHLKFNVPNYVNVEWLKIGLEQEVPGNVMTSFISSSTVQSILDAEEISKYIWNKNCESKKKVYEVNCTKFDIWKTLSNKSIEELVLLYLQVEKGYFIYSLTLKENFPTYECQMVNKDGKHAYPQVKSGDVSLDTENYKVAFECDKQAEVYLFATSEKYINDCFDNIHCLSKKELEDFIVKNKKILPSLTTKWLELCRFFDD